MVLERILLQTIKFDLQVEHPYQFLLKYAKQLKGKGEKLLKELFTVKSSLYNDLMVFRSCFSKESESRRVGSVRVRVRVRAWDIRLADSRYYCNC